MESIFDVTMSNLERGVKVTTQAQEVVAQNIANANTPGYVPKRFDEVLNKAIENQDKKSVIIEEEMAELSKNESKHSAYIKLLASKLSILRTVISQGRK